MKMKILSTTLSCFRLIGIALVGLVVFSFDDAVVSFVEGNAASSPPPVKNIQVTLKGKKYTIDDPVTTISELQERLEDKSGVSPKKQGKILHDGKRLTSDAAAVDSLSEAGVSDGDLLNCIPSSSSPKKKSTTTTATSSASVVSGSADADADDATAATGGGLDDLLKKMMAGGMGGNGGDGKPPDMKEQMKMLKELTSSPLFTEYMNDPIKLEEARQMILTNPMLKGMLSGMPGMSQLLESKESWATAMQAAGQMMQSMDADEMIRMAEQTQSMMAGGGFPGMPGAGGMGGMGGGLFGDGNIPKATTSTTALDELSEDE